MQPTTYVLDGNLADLGTSALVRRLAGVSVAESDVTRIATALGLKGTPTRTEAANEVQDTVYEVRDGDAMLTVNTGGGVTSIYYSNTSGATSGGSDGSVGSGTTDGSSSDGNPPSDGAEEPPSAPPVREPADELKPFVAEE